MGTYDWTTLLPSVQVEEWTMACTEPPPYLCFGIGTTGTSSFAQIVEWNEFFSGQRIALAIWSGVEAPARARVCPLYRVSVARHSRGRPSLARIHTSVLRPAFVRIRRG